MNFFFLFGSIFFLKRERGRQTGQGKTHSTIIFIILGRIKGKGIQVLVLLVFV